MVSLWVILGIVFPAVVVAVLCVGPHFWTGGDRRRRDRHDAEGLVIYAESIRLLGVRWGMKTVLAGLRQAGFTGEFLYWRWHATWRGWLVLPAIMDRRMLEREAQRLAEFITRRKRRHPQRPIYLIGYSCGGFVAIRALELLEAGMRVDAAAVIAGAFAPSRNLRPACDHVSRKMLVCSSLADWLIIGLLTTIFGTADRRHTPSAGMVGLTSLSNDKTCVRSIRWKPSMIRLGYWGEHFSASSAGFVRRHVAPAMGICE